MVTKIMIKKAVRGECSGAESNPYGLKIKPNLMWMKKIN